MDSRSKRRRMNVEDDRLSSLPDVLMAKILSYNSIKQAIETSVLSSEWKYIWTQVPYLNFSSEDFSNKTPKFYKFLTRVFSSCDHQVEFSLNLCGKASQVFIKKILKDACSRNIQKLTFTSLYDTLIELDLSLFSSKSLKHLSLIGSDDKYGDCIMPTSMWELPELTTLHLDQFTLYDDNTNKCVGLFSKCPNLKTLTLDNFLVMESATFTICHPHISNLTLKNRSAFPMDVVKVVTPRLKNLTVVDCDGTHMISAPDLTSLIYKNHNLHISVVMDSLPSLEKVELCVCDPFNADGARKAVNLLQKFYNVRFLTLSMEIVESISKFVELIAHLPSPFFNLKNLKIYPELLHDSFEGKVTIPTEVKNYFLDSSPSATFTMFSRKVRINTYSGKIFYYLRINSTVKLYANTQTLRELRAVRDTKLAKDLMEELRVLLDQEKSQNKSHKAVMKPQPTRKMPADMSERVTQIESYWVDLNEQINVGKRKTIHIIKLIQRIKDLLINLPISKKDEMQPEFSRLCAAADTVMDEVVNRMKIGCSEKGSCLGVCLHELATAAKSSF